MKWFGIACILAGVGTLILFVRRLLRRAKEEEAPLLSYEGGVQLSNDLQLVVGGAGLIIVGVYLLRN